MEFILRNIFSDQLVIINTFYMQGRLFRVLGGIAYNNRAAFCRFSTNIEVVLKNYSNELAQSLIMEKMMPRKFS